MAGKHRRPWVMKATSGVYSVLGTTAHNEVGGPFIPQSLLRAQWCRGRDRDAHGVAGDKQEMTRAGQGGSGRCGGDCHPPAQGQAGSLVLGKRAHVGTPAGRWGRGRGVSAVVHPKPLPSPGPADSAPARPAAGGEPRRAWRRGWLGHLDACTYHSQARPGPASVHSASLHRTFSLFSRRGP